MEKILVTGGAGYIGSHTIVELYKAGHSVVVVDNLANSSPDAVRRVQEITGHEFPFYEIDCADKPALARVFDEHDIDAAIHFAGRFAAKEAAMKALGTGHSQGVLWRDVEVVRRGGPPQLALHGGAARQFAAMGGRRSLLTITHSETLALAEVLILAD